MKKRSTRQKFIAFLLLLLTVFSSTPKKYLHDLVADHTDYYAFHTGEATSLDKAGIDCDTEDLVVSTPFIEAPIATFSLSQPHYPIGFSLTYQAGYTTPSQTKDSRGPPRLI